MGIDVLLGQMLHGHGPRTAMQNSRFSNQSTLLLEDLNICSVTGLSIWYSSNSYNGVKVSAMAITLLKWNRFGLGCENADRNWFVLYSGPGQVHWQAPPVWSWAGPA